MMCGHVFVKVKMRAVGARRFVREFKKEYGDQSIVHKSQMAKYGITAVWQKGGLLRDWP